jgi:hypothetical protein
MTGIERIAAERKRQIKDEGFTAWYDSRWVDDELAAAAASYAYPEDEGHISWRRVVWPFSEDRFKPTPENRIRELERAGALIAAEIDRLQRLGASKNDKI